MEKRGKISHLLNKGEDTMAFIIGGKEVVIKEVPILADDVDDAMYIRVDMPDEDTQELWSLYRWQNELYRRKK